MGNDASYPSPLRFVGATAYGLVGLWFVFAIMMASAGRFVSGPGKPPLALGLTVSLPILFFVTLYLRRGAFWAFCHTLDLPTIIAVHLGRLLAIDFVLCGIEGRLPAGFALPAGIGDILIGLTAVPLALAIFRRAPAARRWFVAWNCLGLLDLVLAVGLGVLHSPSTLGIFARPGLDTRLMGELPRSLVPTFFVPLLVLLHLLALARRKEIASSQRDG